jgi:hypothetical protein
MWISANRGANKEEKIMEKESVFYRKNVPYRVGVRTDLKDANGMILDDENPYVEVDKRDLRKFLQANKYGIEKGLIVEIPEPPLETYSVNSITDEQAEALVKDYHALRKRLPEITSDAAVLKLLDAAKTTKRKEATINLIMERYEEISPNAMVTVT